MFILIHVGMIGHLPKLMADWWWRRYVVPEDDDGDNDVQETAEDGDTGV